MLRRIGCSSIVALVLSAGLAAPAGQTPQPQLADLVLMNGTVLTVDAKDSVAEAVAIAHGTIVAVGSNQSIKPMIGPKTRMIDLRGRTATPGLIDTHCHFQEDINLLDLGDTSIKSMADVIAKVRARATGMKPGTWVRGRGWDEGKLAERRYILASDLDQAAPNNPVWLMHTTGHYGVANSMAMLSDHRTGGVP
jgi:predicted amidohydrolase YtcJ